MYSVVLLAAMTMPAEQPNFGRLRGGCAGACAGCVGACYGCFGGWYDAGCWGGGWGAGWGGCSCSGCWSTGGFKTFFSCHGAGSCWGHAYAGVGFGFAGCYGSCYGSYTNYFSYWAAPMVGHPAPAVYGAPLAPAVPMAPTPMGPATVPSVPGEPPPAAKPMDISPPAGNPEPTPKPAGAVGDLGRTAPATVIISLPADATLMANGQMTRQTLAERTFATPPLQPGRRYHYDFTAEVVRDGQLVSETRQVEVFAGREVRVTFAKLIAATKTDSTQIAVR